MPQIDTSNEGFITRFVRYVFILLSGFSFMFILSAIDDKYRSRMDIKLTEAENKKFAEKRVFRIDLYIAAWITAETALILGSIALDNDGLLFSTFFVAAVFLSVNRIIEIFQVLVNIVLFDAKSLTVPLVANRERIIVLAVINYLELIVLFGIIYALNFDLIRPDKSDPIDGYYLSAMSHFTIGFGDVSPAGYLRFIVSLQGFCSAFFIILIFARFMTMFTPIRVLSDESKKDGQVQSGERETS